MKYRFLALVRSLLVAVLALIPTLFAPENRSVARQSSAESSDGLNGDSSTL